MAVLRGVCQDGSGSINIAELTEFVWGASTVGLGDSPPEKGRGEWSAYWSHKIVTRNHHRHHNDCDCTCACVLNCGCGLGVGRGSWSRTVNRRPPAATATAMGRTAPAPPRPHRGRRGAERRRGRREVGLCRCAAGSPPWQATNTPGPLIPSRLAHADFAHTTQHKTTQNTSFNHG